MTAFARAVASVRDGVSPEAAARELIAQLTENELLWLLDGDAPFWRGLIANLLNPKALIFYVTLLPGFMSPERAPFWAQALILSGAHIVVSVLVHGAIVLIAARAGVLLGQSGRMRVLRRVLAVGIALIAL